MRTFANMQTESSKFHGADTKAESWQVVAVLFLTLTSEPVRLLRSQTRDFRM